MESEQFVTIPEQFGGPGGAGPDDRLQRAEHVVGALDKGIAVLSPDLVIRWVNGPFRQWCPADPIGKGFFDALDTSLDARPPDDAFHAALGGSPSCFRMRQHALLLDVTVSPVKDGTRVHELVALCDDVTAAVIRQQKLNALYNAGPELDALDEDELSEMNVACRVALLKLNLRRQIHDLLRYNVIEVRLLDPKTRRLDPLLEEGMLPAAAQRELYAREEGNGVTGFVAATGRPYLCPDTDADPHYLPGSAGARSSMTVPVVFRDEVIGTFNVESPQPNAFGPEDLQFTELYARELGRTLHTLNLLQAREVYATAGAIAMINEEIALPGDDLLAAASTLMDRVADRPDLVGLVEQILAAARKIKLSVRLGGGDLARSCIPVAHPTLDALRILVVDGDERIRKTAHKILEHLGCVVESAGTAAEGIAMARAGTYDAVIVATKQKDAGGTATYRSLVKAAPLARVILMKGYEYDYDHTEVNARKDGYWLPILSKQPLAEAPLFRALTCPPPTPADSVAPVAVAS